MFVATTRRSSEPLAGLRHLNSVLDEAFGLSQFDPSGAITSSWVPPADVFEDRDSVKIMVELPGVPAEDVKISLENNILTIRGEKKQQKEETNERVHRYERSYGLFERSFALPDSVDPDRVKAKYANGILTRS